MEAVVYLDTHVVVFLYSGVGIRFGPRTRAAIENNALRISPVVGLELQYLYETGRTSLPARPVIEELAETIGLTVCDLSFVNVCLRAEKLSWTRDPFDRLIVAHAMIADEVLITKDRYIRRHYKKALWG